MINHNEPFKGKGSKNKNIAREFGAALAQSWFEDMSNPEAQGVLFDWSNIPNMAKVGLGIYYRKTPANILELKEISHDSFESQYTELKKNTFRKMVIFRLEMILLKLLKMLFFKSPQKIILINHKSIFTQRRKRKCRRFGQRVEIYLPSRNYCSIFEK